MNGLHERQMTTFRLTKECKDQLLRCVDLLREQDEIDGRYWGKLDRTDALHRAVADMLTQLEMAKQRRELPAQVEQAVPKKKPAKKAGAK